MRAARDQGRRRVGARSPQRAAAFVRRECGRAHALCVHARIARGVPEEAVRLATQRLASINDAYDEIMQMRQRAAPA